MLDQKRNAWLDTLRAIAILAVMVCHFCSSFHQLHPASSSEHLAFTSIGGHGVDLFFVLSGWLLGCLLLREKQSTNSINVRRFWVRRWLRTLPAYYAVLIATLAQRAIQDRWQLTDTTYFFFLQTYALGSLPFLGISWSLCIEEHFYLLIAPMLILLRSRSAISFGLSLLVLLPTLARWLLNEPYPTVTHLRLDSCAFGVLIAHLYVNYPGFWRSLLRISPWINSGFLLLFLLLIIQRFRGSTPDLPLEIYVFASGAMVVLSDRSAFWKSRASSRMLRYIASRSYSLYLVHVESIAFVRRLEIHEFFLFFAACLIVSVILAEILFRLVERPWMQFRDRHPRKTDCNSRPNSSSETVHAF